MSTITYRFTANPATLTIPGYLGEQFSNTTSNQRDATVRACAEAYAEAGAPETMSGTVTVTATAD